VKPLSPAAKHRLRWIGVTVGAGVALFGLVGFFGMPLLLRHVMTRQVAAALHRPVSVGAISVNPYTLTVEIKQLQIGERATSHPFVEIGHLHITASWASLFRLALVVKALRIERPALHLVRMADQRFNVSDLLDRATAADTSRQPFRFAVSNLQLTDGTVQFDDQVLGERHTVEHVQLGVPVITNLPADGERVVHPHLQMVVDGSPLGLAGTATPFATPPVSVVDLQLHRLDLSRYSGYLPSHIPIKLSKGTLSGTVQVQVVNAPSHPRIHLGGTMAIEQLELRDGANAPLLDLTHAVTTLTDVAPLEQMVHLGRISLDGLTVYAVRHRDRTTNFTSLVGRPAPSHGAQAQATTAATPATPTDLALEMLELSDSTLHVTDQSGATPVALALQGLHGGLTNLRTTSQTPASFELGAHLSGGGSMAVTGRLDLAHSQVTTEVSLDEIDLPALQDLAPSGLAARLTAGTLRAQATVQTQFATDHVNVHVEPATVSLDHVAVHVPGQQETPIAWTRLSASIAQVDWAARQVMVDELRAHGVQVFVRHERQGGVNLASLLRASAASTPHDPAASASASPWHYRIASVAIDTTEARLEDDAAPRHVELVVAPMHLSLQDLSSDLSQPIALALDGTLNGQGRVTVTGTVVPAPLTANLRIGTQRLDLTALDPYVSDTLNTTMTSAALTMDGALALATTHDQLRVSYRGDATLGNVRLRDRVTSDSFLRWTSCSARRIHVELGAGPPTVQIGALALTNFEARVILNADGRLTLSDITRTRAPPASGRQTPPSSAPAATSARPLAAVIALGRTTLQGGHVTFTDNFITPHYTADVTAIAGTVGAFGTRATAPAEVALQGQLNGRAPIAINGAVNPLAPRSFVDLKAKADGVELPGLTPYSAKYTGYPIVKGTLTVNVHYLLEQSQLTADNHLFIDQLTFGERVESRDATNLPVQLAVALLKNARGEIAVDVPVSGSLSDPQFSLGGAILDAFRNLIVKVATSPFHLIASAFGTQEDLDYVDFAPGLATLMPDSQHKLATIARALQERPALRLDISGRIDPQVDREGLREARLTSLIKRRKMQEIGGHEDADRVPLTPDEYDTYLKRVYKTATFPKPRNLLGMDKSLPPDEMKKLLLTNMEITDQDLQHLADERAQAVRQWLSGQVEAARLIVVAPKLTADGSKKKGQATRVDLSLK
jgi:outer membrane protein OmpA-like peptidoglycan-associated protein